MQSTKNVQKIVALLLISLTSFNGAMQPLKKEGKYYYSPEDTHTHISLSLALKKVGNALWGTQKPVQAATDPRIFMSPHSINLHNNSLIRQVSSG